MRKTAACVRGAAAAVALWVLSPLPAQAETEEAAVARLQSAIRIPTISWGDIEKRDRGAFEDYLAFLAESFPLVHAHLQRELINEYTPLYTWQGSDPSRRPFLILHHYDVVPVPEGQEEKWPHPSFSGARAGGYIWGRGAMDDKSSQMSVLEAAERLLAEGFAPKRTIYFMFGHDEERGGPEGAAGTAALLAERGVQLEFTLDEGMAILNEMVPGVEEPVALIGVAEKGFLTLEITAHAHGGHSSAPLKRTAIGALSRAIIRLEEQQMPARLTPPVAGMFSQLASHMEFPVSFVAARPQLFSSVLLSQLQKSNTIVPLIRTTTAVTMIDGGVKSNVLPSSAVATVNFRLLPGDSIEDVINHVTTVIDDPEVAVRVVTGNEASPVADMESPSYDLIRRTIRKTFPDAVTGSGLCVAGTDSPHFTTVADNNYRFAPMRWWSEDLSRIHGIGERVKVENYGEMIDFHAEFMRMAQD